LTREQFGHDQVYAVGFGFYEGSVIAADTWGDPYQEIPVPKAQMGSWEQQLHESGAFNKFLLFDQTNHSLFNQTVGHRAIGVTYNPQYEHMGNYVPSRLSERYDAFIHFEQTKALQPLN